MNVERIENLKSRINTLEFERECAYENKEFGKWAAHGAEIEVLTQIITDITNKE